jgi:hypothetical protein
MTPTPTPTTPADFLVWSNQKGAWWRPNHSGYTSIIDEAGRYTLAEATAIVDGATVGGQLVHHRTDPVTGRAYDCYDEVVVPAPPYEFARVVAT